MTLQSVAFTLILHHGSHPTFRSALLFVSIFCIVKGKRAIPTSENAVCDISLTKRTQTRKLNVPTKSGVAQEIQYTIQYPSSS